MNLPWNHWAPRLVLLGLASCSLDLGGDAGEAPLPEVPPDAPSPVLLAFEEQGPLQLAPGELRTVWVAGQPPAPYEVSFTLLGDAAGAWLDRTTVMADADGRASVQLHASSLGSTFRLRAATKHGPAAELGVSVSAEGFGTLRVIPVYQGKRHAKEWTASVVAGVTCEELATAAPESPAGALVAHGGPGDPVEVPGAPVGLNLAVALHSGRILWGCTGERDLQAGTSRDVWVPVRDLPIDLAATSLNAKLMIASAEGLDALLDTATAEMVDAFLPAGEEAVSLLDAMERVAPPEDASDFDAQRRERGWDTSVQAHLAALPVSLRDRCRGWARAGQAAAPLAIHGKLSGLDDAPGSALFEVSWLGSATAESAGIPAPEIMSWTADPGDVLRLAGTLSWIPSLYAGGAAVFGASLETEAESVPEALAAAADCATLGEALVGYAGCDGDCMAALCASALKIRWNDGLEALKKARQTGKIVVNASGRAQVNSAAAPVSWTADWLGAIRYGDEEASVEGVVDAVSTDVIAN
ncbi:hypothetical protein [Sorangium sp. So ce1024]|uniref:hypothetical protein n=1 Tax=unclassified Sorangium TaxID=2621164 RepID=UPI003F0B665C